MSRSGTEKGTVTALLAPARPGLACGVPPPRRARRAPPPRRPRLHLAAGCAYLRRPPAPPRTGEKGEQPPPPTRTSTGAARRLASPPAPCAHPPPPRWVRQLPVRAEGGRGRAPPSVRARARQAPSPGAGRRGAPRTAAPPALPRTAAAGRFFYLPGGSGDGRDSGSGRAAAAESKSDLGREERKWRPRKPRLALGGGRVRVWGGSLSRCLEERTARPAAIGCWGRAGFFGRRNRRAASLGVRPGPDPNPAAAGTGAAPPLPPLAPVSAVSQLRVEVGGRGQRRPRRGGQSRLTSARRGARQGPGPRRQRQAGAFLHGVFRAVELRGERGSGVFVLCCGL